MIYPEDHNLNTYRSANTITHLQVAISTLICWAKSTKCLTIDFQLVVEGSLTGVNLRATSHAGMLSGVWFIALYIGLRIKDHVTQLHDLHGAIPSNSIWSSDRLISILTYFQSNVLTININTVKKYIFRNKWHKILFLSTVLSSLNWLPSVCVWFQNPLSLTICVFYSLQSNAQNPNCATPPL